MQLKYLMDLNFKMQKRIDYERKWNFAFATLASGRMNCSSPNS